MAPKPPPQARPDTSVPEQIDAELQALRHLIEGLDPGGSPRLAFVWRAADGIRHPGQRLGVLSGSFNPLTRSHARLAELAAETCRLDEVALELAVANVDKRAVADELAARLWVLRRYASQHDGLSVAACSHGRFIDKVRAVERAYPAGTILFFIVGFDTLVRVFDPRYYTDPEAELAELFARSQFVVANRDPVTPADIRRWLEDPARQRHADRIHVVELDGFRAGISATQVRVRLAAGQSIDDLVPPEVVSAVQTMWRS